MCQSGNFKCQNMSKICNTKVEFCDEKCLKKVEKNCIIGENYGTTFCRNKFSFFYILEIL